MLALGVAALLLITGWLGLLIVRERVDPSGHVALRVNGERVLLQQPTQLVVPNPGPAGNSSPVGPGKDSGAPSAGVGTAAGPGSTPLPPLRIEIERIGLDFPVVLADNAHLPIDHTVGWYFQSAFPGTAGNSVFLGHLDGPGATFAHLDQLQPGDRIRIRTQTAILTYSVDELRVIDESAVEVLAPTSTPVITLLTCAGEWDAVHHTYHQRLLVRGHYTAFEAQPAGA